MITDTNGDGQGDSLLVDSTGDGKLDRLLCKWQGLQMLINEQPNPHKVAGFAPGVVVSVVRAFKQEEEKNFDLNGHQRTLDSCRLCGTGLPNDASRCPRCGLERGANIASHNESHQNSSNSTFNTVGNTDKPTLQVSLLFCLVDLGDLIPIDFR